MTESKNGAIKGTIKFTVEFNKVPNKSKLNPIGRVANVDGVLTFLPNSPELSKITGKPVFLMNELSEIIPEGDYSFNGSIKKSNSAGDYYYFTPLNIEGFFKVFGREFKSAKK